MFLELKISAPNISIFHFVLVFVTDEDKQNIGKPASDNTKALKRRHSNDNEKSKKKRVEEGKISDLLLWTLD